MESNVYQVHFQPQQLPENPEDIQAFTRSYVLDLVGRNTKETIDFSMEQAYVDNSFRLVITVPQRMENEVRNIESAGLLPTHTESEVPTADNGSCNIPRAFQIRHFGSPVDPEGVPDNPSAMAAISTALMANTDDLPPEAFDYLRWTNVSSDENTEILTVYWDNDDQT